MDKTDVILNNIKCELNNNIKVISIEHTVSTDTGIQAMDEGEKGSERNLFRMVKWQE